MWYCSFARAVERLDSHSCYCILKHFLRFFSFPLTSFILVLLFPASSFFFFSCIIIMICKGQCTILNINIIYSLASFLYLYLLIFLFSLLPSCPLFCLFPWLVFTCRLLAAFLSLNLSLLDSFSLHLTYLLLPCHCLPT